MLKLVPSADFLIENEDKYGYTIKYYDAADQLYAAVSGGQIDAMMDDYQSLATPSVKDKN